MGSNSKCSKIVRIAGIARVHEGGGAWWVVIVSVVRIVRIVGIARVHEGGGAWWVEWQQCVE